MVKEIHLVSNEINYQTDNIYKGYGIYYGKVVSIKGQALAYFTAYEMSAVMCWDEFKNGRIQGGCEEMSETEISLRIPYFSDGEKAVFFGPKGEKLLTVFSR